MAFFKDFRAEMYFWGILLSKKRILIRFFSDHLWKKDLDQDPFRITSEKRILITDQDNFIKESLDRWEILHFSFILVVELFWASCPWLFFVLPTFGQWFSPKELVSYSVLKSIVVMDDGYFLQKSFQLQSIVALWAIDSITTNAKNDIGIVLLHFIVTS